MQTSFFFFLDLLRLVLVVHVNAVVFLNIMQYILSQTFHLFWL